jgi:hypothetical protein
MKFVHQSDEHLATKSIAEATEEILSTTDGTKHLGGESVLKVIVKKGTVVFITAKTKNRTKKN